MLNKSFEDNIEIEKGQPIGFFVVELESLKGEEKQNTKRQTGDFLNRYDFAHALRDTVNQAAINQFLKFHSLNIFFFFLTLTFLFLLQQVTETLSSKKKFTAAEPKLFSDTGCTHMCVPIRQFRQ